MPKFLPLALHLWFLSSIIATTIATAQKQVLILNFTDEVFLPSYGRLVRDLYARALPHHRVHLLETEFVPGENLGNPGAERCAEVNQQMTEQLSALRLRKRDRITHIYLLMHGNSLHDPQVGDYTWFGTIGKIYANHHSGEIDRLFEPIRKYLAPNVWIINDGCSTMAGGDASAQARAAELSRALGIPNARISGKTTPLTTANSRLNFNGRRFNPRGAAIAVTSLVLSLYGMDYVKDWASAEWFRQGILALGIGGFLGGGVDFVSHVNQTEQWEVNDRRFSEEGRILTLQNGRPVAYRKPFAKRAFADFLGLGENDCARSILRASWL